MRDNTFAALEEREERERKRERERERRLISISLDWDALLQPRGKGNRRTASGGLQGLRPLQMQMSDLTVIGSACLKVYCRRGFSPYTIVSLYLFHSASTCEERIRTAQQGQRKGVQLPRIIYTERAGGNCQQRPF
jgi:hypothetical protein